MRKKTTDNTFDSLFRRHYANLVNYACLLVPEDDAKDIVQNVFSWLLEHPDTLSRIQNGETASYLLKSVYNGCMNHIRNKKHDMVYREWIGNGVKQDYMCYDPDNDSLIRRLFTQDLTREIDALIDALPPRSREVFILAYHDRMPHKRIAEVMGTTVSTVENQLYSSLKSLRESLRGEKKEKFFKIG